MRLSLAICTLLACVATAMVEPGKPLELKPGQRQLFLDVHVVKRNDGLKRTMNRWEKTKHHERSSIHAS